MENQKQEVSVEFKDEQEVSVEDKDKIIKRLIEINRNTAEQILSLATVYNVEYSGLLEMFIDILKGLLDVIKEKDRLIDENAYGDGIFDKLAKLQEEVKNENMDLEEFQKEFENIMHSEGIN